MLWFNSCDSYKTDLEYPKAKWERPCTLNFEGLRSRKLHVWNWKLVGPLYDIYQDRSTVIYNMRRKSSARVSIGLNVEFLTLRVKQSCILSWSVITQILRCKTVKNLIGEKHSSTQTPVYQTFKDKLKIQLFPRYST